VIGFYLSAGLLSMILEQINIFPQVMIRSCEKSILRSFVDVKNLSLAIRGLEARRSLKMHAAMNTASFLLLLCLPVHGFISLHPRPLTRLGSLAAKEPEAMLRRSMLISTIAGGAGVAFAPATTFASGGATAGGAYLIRAKQRYSARVTKGAEAYMGLGDAVASGKLTAAPFFAGDKNSPAEDFLGAAFLLANAFRSNSTASPDTLPTVRKFKAFMKEYEATLALAKKKNNVDATVASYDRSVALLKEYLASVEL